MISISADSPVPAYEQIREQVADLIQNGALSAGHKLPSIRQLAGDLRIAPGTVARAYTELESSGLIESSRATGTRVRSGQQSDVDLRMAAANFATAAKCGGGDLEQALSAVRAAWGSGAPG